MKWLRLQLRAGLRAARQMARQPFNTLLAALVVGIAAALPATGYMLLGNLQRLAGNVSAAPEISVFMQPGANADAVRTADQRIRGLAKEAKVELVSRDAALKRFRDNDALAEILDALPDNPFADAFVIRLDSADAARLETLRTEFSKLPEVDHVQLDSAWAKRLDALIALGQQAVTMLGVVLGLGLVAVTFNTIRLQLLTQRDEIEVSRLLGATDAWIRRPFHWFGALQGLLGGALAGALALLATRALAGPIAEIAGLYSLEFVLRPLAPAHWAALLALCAVLGWLGASASVRRHLSRIA
ncbi:permease-like cell division protein FtsX [Methyloversatilis sp. XJ19-49]|uniref:permease-like cell division protein FtsX n=1 Tax=Methyloversatilis sp. XJ19-49 TaxID=2963429 RepID=UPI00211C1C47|nr:permease-like cell division protein FtsX [Methyloversatilis sp. XJ19-49]MCQ9380013.1 permease-like cell division protein FtsX [Methyloversatilis sp. XJ19-49]